MNQSTAKLLEQFSKQRSNATTTGDPDEEDLPCWGFVRGNRRAFNVEFRRHKGSWRALEYAWLQFAEWCPVESPFTPGVAAPAGSIILKYSDGHRVLIAGRNLRDPYQKLLEHQVKYFKEADRVDEHLSPDDTAIVARIEVIIPPPAEGEGA